jgi:hypothetical protein
MSKPSKRPGRAARDVHAAIREAAELFRNAPSFMVSNAEDHPEVAALMTACSEAVEAGIPKSVVFEGRTYWLTVALTAIRLDVYASPAESRPLFSGASASTRGHGHKPGH